MSRGIHIDAKDSRPIWRQVQEEVERMIGLGLLSPEDALPSVRELSKRLTINPATVSKAYQKLAVAGLLEVRRGEGTFVASELPELAPQERRERLEQAATRYVDSAQGLGSHREEAVRTLESTWEGSAAGRTRE